MKEKHVAWFPGTRRVEIYPDLLTDRIKNQLENDKVKVFTGSLENRFI